LPPKEIIYSNDNLYILCNIYSRYNSLIYRIDYKGNKREELAFDFKAEELKEFENSIIVMGIQNH